MPVCTVAAALQLKGLHLCVCWFAHAGFPLVSIPFARLHGAVGSGSPNPVRDLLPLFHPPAGSAVRAESIMGFSPTRRLAPLRDGGRLPFAAVWPAAPMLL